MSRAVRPSHNPETRTRIDIKRSRTNAAVACASAITFSLSIKSPRFNMNVHVTTPDTVMAIATWEATQDLRLSGLIRWANWSNLDLLNIYAEGELQGQNPYHWQDTWLFSIGADYRLNNEWTVRGGLAYETGAVDDVTLRLATILDVGRVWFSLGATYNYSKQIQFDFGATYLMGVGNMDLHFTQKNPLTGESCHGKGEYDSMDAYIIGTQVQYRF